jgi:hypothetical protein
MINHPTIVPPLDTAREREILRHYGFTVENVVTRALGLLSTPAKRVKV